jgi:hypothetical protein
VLAVVATDAVEVLDTAVEETVLTYLDLTQHEVRTVRADEAWT